MRRTARRTPARRAAIAVAVAAASLLAVGVPATGAAQPPAGTTPGATTAGGTGSGPGTTGAPAAAASSSTPAASTPAGSTPTGTAPASAMAAVPAAPQSNISPYPVLDRLGRWNGTTFEPVSAGSIRAGRVIVLSHGWSPGFEASVQQLQRQQAGLVTVWTPGLTDTKGQTLLQTWVPVAQALQGADPGATVVLFSWVDQSATTDDPLDVRDGELATEVNGHRLATAIDEALADDFYAGGGQVHLVGHSFGANVATTAALALRVPPRQLTLLDSPETTIAELGGAKNDLRYKLPRLDIGRGPGQTFVDNYISFVGIPYSSYPGLEQVVDVRTTPPPADSAGDKHSFAIVWYRTSAQDRAAGVGFWWSPLLGYDVSTLGSSYRQPEPTPVLDLVEEAGPPPAGVRTQLLTSVAALDTPGPAVGLRGDGTTTWNLAFSTDETSLWLDFGLDLGGRPGDLLSVFVDGRQRYVAAVAADGTGGEGRFAILYDVQPGGHTLTVTLTGPDSVGSASPSSTASLSDLRLASTADIQRGYTTRQTDELLVGVVVALLVVVLLAVALLVLVARRIVRAVHRHDHHDAPPAG